MPIQLELKVMAGKPIYRGHDHYWKVIRDLGRGGQHFTLREIALRSNDRQDKCIKDFLRRLKAAGFLKVVHTEKFALPNGGFTHRDVYELIKRPAATPQVNRDGSPGMQGLGQQQLWTAMRTLTQFNKHEVAIAAATDEVQIAMASAERYCIALQNAGYLAIIRPGGPGQARIWRLKPSMNTGPSAPKILKSKMVFDANLARIMGQPEAVEVAA